MVACATKLTISQTKQMSSMVYERAERRTAPAYSLSARGMPATTA